MAGERAWTALQVGCVVGLAGAAWLAMATVTGSGQTMAAPTPVASPAQAPAAPEPDGPLIVLDPGHGGSNSGAPGVVGGVFEKQLTLDLALRTARALQQRGVRVKLTRTSDRYLSLRQRSTMANQADADVFVSIHCNASPAHSRSGFETFLLTPTAIDIDAVALRSEDGPPRPGLPPATSAMLDDIERGLSHPRALRVAKALQKHLAEVRGPTRDRGVRQASMDVLYGATMPAVLVEVGFIDHPIEGRELTSPEVRQRIAEALAAALAEHVTIDRGPEA